MKLQKIVNRLQKLHPKEIDLSLNRVKKLCKTLGDPQDKLKTISVVGTNGKYSTIQALFAILREANINKTDPLKKLLEVLNSPYSEQKNISHYQTSSSSKEKYQTFCGT